MPLASLSAGAAALIGLAASAAAGGVKGLVDSRATDKANQHDKDMATIHTTKPGFDDFGNELAEADPNRFGLNMKERPVIFPGQPGYKRFNQNKFSL